MHLKALGIILLSMLVCVGLVIGWQTLSRLMFSENPRYAIRTLDISTELCVTPQRLKELTGIREGVNLHAFSAAKKRASIMPRVSAVSGVCSVTTSDCAARSASEDARSTYAG